MSAEVKLTEVGFSLSGEVRFANVLALRRDGDRLIKGSLETALNVDLSGITATDVSALSLLLRWLHQADRQNKQINFTAIPESLLKVATVCGVGQLIGG